MTAPLELPHDVQGQYRPLLLSSGVTPPARWSIDELSELRFKFLSRSGGPSKGADTLTALLDGLQAKHLFLKMGGTTLEIGCLYGIYRSEIDSWPEGNSIDALLVEAADVELTEHSVKPLRALTRFMTGIAARLGVDPGDHAEFSDWISSRGQLVADARRRYRDLQETPAWLLIDFGDEPTEQNMIWPDAITWTRCAKDSVMAGTVTCQRTEEDAKRALCKILDEVPPARPLLIDFAVPYPLMNKGIERWKICRVDGEVERLPVESRPRLRWSRRRRDLVLHNRLLKRAANASWEEGAAELSDVILSDIQRLRKWIEDHPQQACLVGGLAVSDGKDPLRLILREGFGFVVWLSPEFQAAHRRRVCMAVQDVPTLARRRLLPDELLRYFSAQHPAQHPAIIWDDPFGREDFDIPPLVLPEPL